MKHSLNAGLKVLLLAGLMLSVNAAFAYEGDDEAEFSIVGSDYVDEGVYAQEDEFLQDEADFQISASEYVRDRELRNAEAAEQAKGQIASRW